MKSFRQRAVCVPRDPKRGFALVITLSLMILLTVIAVGLLSLASITLRASTQSRALDTARQNARMALVLAIGELQKHAGQDQRITATADMAASVDGLALAPGATPLNDKSVNNISKGLSSVRPGTRYWTGVFANRDTPASIFTKTPSPVIVQWLVSGNSTSYPFGGPVIRPSDATYEVAAGGSVGDSAKAVVLVGEHSVGRGTDSTNRFVVAPLVDIRNGESARPVGRFAWWVGDEGVKARINIDKTLDSPANYASLTNQRRGWETIDGFAAYPTPAAGPHAALPGLVTLGETPLLIPGSGDRSSGTSPLQNVFHAATTESRALLADSMNGGMKIDLTAILAETLPTAKAVATIANYPVKGTNIIPTAAASSIKAPKWDAMKEFNDRAKSMESGSLLAKAATSDTTAGIAPLVTDFRILFGARFVTKAANSFGINPCGKIAITLANP